MKLKDVIQGTITKAQQLATARKIGNASFDGSTDITLDDIGVPKLSTSTAITTAGTYTLDAVEKNASIAGTLANQLTRLNTDLMNISHIEICTSESTSVAASAAAYINITAPVISGFEPVLATLYSTNNSMLFCFGISQNNNIFTLGVRNMMASATNIKASICVLYTRSEI